MGCFQCPRFAKVNEKLIAQKGVSSPQISLYKNLK
jgi:hypothetical protein